MARLGRVVTEAIVHHYGRAEFLRRMSHPFWFQSFGAVMGMDWLRRSEHGWKGVPSGRTRANVILVADALGEFKINRKRRLAMCKKHSSEQGHRDTRSMQTHCPVLAGPVL
jgi:hypothetical protein